MLPTFFNLIFIVCDVDYYGSQIKYNDEEGVIFFSIHFTQGILMKCNFVNYDNIK